jgi:NAD(P)-dependent dehydrogenase (short-subunit alcohol dehydrogenase family)
VLGASSGIGRCLALRAAQAGAVVLLSGRRAERLEDIRAAVGGGVICVGDLSEPGHIDELAVAVREFGPVDAVVSTVGSAQLKLLEDMTGSDWRSVFETNVVGVNAAIRAVLPSVRDGAIVAALSSEAVTVPRWALVAYSASKAALEVSLAGWRLEYPRVRFASIGVGATIPTDFGRAFDADLLGPALEIWSRHGQAQEEFMDSDHVGQVICGLLASVLPFPGVNMEHVVLRTPSPVAGSSEFMRAAAGRDL